MKFDISLAELLLHLLLNYFLFNCRILFNYKKETIFEIYTGKILKYKLKHILRS